MRFHKFIRDDQGWRTLADEIAFANPHLEVHRVTVASPTRPEPFPWTVTHRKGAVVIAPRTAEGEFLLVRQERVPIRATIWEFPAGQIDESAETDEAIIRATGLRELREETGYELASNGEVVSLGYFFPSAGFTDEHSHLLLARPVVRSALGHAHDSSEAITDCRAFSPSALRNLIVSGEIRDANTLAAFARLVAMGLLT
jgi:ADP-ribose diphosphatase